MTTLPLLHVCDFTYARAGRLLLKDLSLEISSGDAVVLQGPNGSGKTTLLRCLAGIPDSFSNIIKSAGLTQSYLGHSNALKMGRTVRANLLQQTQVDPNILETIAKARGLIPVLDRQVRTLSMGQQRQVALTRVALSGAKLWLLDEPTTHLDEGAAASFWEELSAHLTAGGCAVLSSHKDVPLPGAKVITFHG